MRGLHVAVLLALGAAALGTTLFVKRTDQQTQADRASRTTVANDIAVPSPHSASRLDASTAAQGTLSSTGKTPTLLSEPEVAPTAIASTNTPAETHATAAPRDGVEAASVIDWSKVRTNQPIPPGMPSRRASLAIDAGFAMEWFERSLGSGLIDSDTVGARYSSTQFLPLVERILSEARNSNDVWANELESSIRAIVTEETPAGTEVASRVFCNGQGCLIYLEPQGETSFEDSHVMDRLLKEPASRRLGLDPFHVYRTTVIPAKFNRWSLFVIDRSR